MNEWLQQRRALVEALSAELRAGFEAVAGFQASAYLDCVERQEALALRLADHDKTMPLPDPDPEAMRTAADALRRMNAELRRLNEIHTALIEAGSRSVRSFQRVWALGAASYELEAAAKHPPQTDTADPSAHPRTGKTSGGEN